MFFLWFADRYKNSEQLNSEEKSLLPTAMKTFEASEPYSENDQYQTRVKNSLKELKAF